VCAPRRSLAKAGRWLFISHTGACAWHGQVSASSRHGCYYSGRIHEALIDAHVFIVLFQRLAVRIAELRGREPDRIRRDDPRWAAAASAAKADNAA